MTEGDSFLLFFLFACTARCAIVRDSILSRESVTSARGTEHPTPPCAENSLNAHFSFETNFAIYSPNILSTFIFNTIKYNFSLNSFSNEKSKFFNKSSQTLTVNFFHLQESSRKKDQGSLRKKDDRRNKKEIQGRSCMIQLHDAAGSQKARHNVLRSAASSLLAAFVASLLFPV